MWGQMTGNWGISMVEVVNTKVQITEADQNHIMKPLITHVIWPHIRCEELLARALRDSPYYKMPLHFLYKTSVIRTQLLVPSRVCSSITHNMGLLWRSSEDYSQRPRFQCSGPGFDPWSGNKDHICYAAKKKKILKKKRQGKQRKPLWAASAFFLPRPSQSHTWQIHPGLSCAIVFTGSDWATSLGCSFLGRSNSWVGTSSMTSALWHFLIALH